MIFKTNGPLKAFVCKIFVKSKCFHCPDELHFFLLCLLPLTIYNSKTFCLNHKPFFSMFVTVRVARYITKLLLITIYVLI